MSKERDLSPGQLARIAGRHADSLRAAGVEWIGAAAPASARAHPAAASPPGASSIFHIPLGEKRRKMGPEPIHVYISG